MLQRMFEVVKVLTRPPDSDALASISTDCPVPTETSPCLMPLISSTPLALKLASSDF